MSAAVEVRDLTVAYEGNIVLDRVTFSVGEGALVGIVGPNGAGKSTLLKAILGLIPRTRGSVQFFGRDLDQVRRGIAYMPQRSDIDWDFPITVLETVLIGTYPRLGWLRRPGKREVAKAYEALDARWDGEVRAPADSPPLGGPAAAHVHRAGPGAGSRAAVFG